MRVLVLWIERLDILLVDGKSDNSTGSESMLEHICMTDLLYTTAVCEVKQSDVIATATGGVTDC